MIVSSHMFRGHSLTYECSHQAVVLAEKLLGPTPGTGPERGVGLRTWRGLKKSHFEHTLMFVLGKPLVPVYL